MGSCDPVRMPRDLPQSTQARRLTLLPPPPSNPDVLQACWEPSWCSTLPEDDFETVTPSNAPTLWQAPPTDFGALPSDDIHYRTIASALAL
jgi:hypothetical protein